MEHKETKVGAFSAELGSVRAPLYRHVSLQATYDPTAQSFLTRKNIRATSGQRHPTSLRTGFCGVPFSGRFTEQVLREGRICFDFGCSLSNRSDRACSASSSARGRSHKGARFRPKKRRSCVRHTFVGRRGLHRARGCRDPPRSA